MCGIIGYVGNRNVIEVLMKGLSALEYRGYDSSGAAIISDNKTKIYKAEGKLQNLKNLLNEKADEVKDSHVGIGHIRWATHGVPNLINAHPHTSNCGKIAVVHNGIIENYKELREKLTKMGAEFKSETDTETVAHLVAFKYKETHDLKEAVTLAAKELEGAYALCVVHQDEGNKIVATRRNAPLVVGIGDGEMFAASDVPAMIEYTKQAIYLDDNQVAVLTNDKIELFDENNKQIQPKIELLPWEPVSLSKMGYKHFMLKEIHEQPNVIRNFLTGKIHTAKEKVKLDEVKLDFEQLKQMNRIQIVACGTSLHAAMVGKYIIEELCNIPVDIEPSSEYIYRHTVTDEKTLVIGVSQSGETADTLTAVRQSKARNSHILIITNRPDSSMAREADSLIPVDAGIEVSVAATKSYIAQLTAFYLLAIHLAEIKNSCDNDKLVNLKNELLILPQKIELFLTKKEKIQKCSRMYSSSKNFIFIARGLNYPTALEGALKLKEISYINATGYPAGELKHGPIAMIDETLPVLSILMDGKVYEKVLSNAQESKARNARMIALTDVDSDERLEELFDFVLNVPHVDELVSPIMAIVPLQLLAYYIAEFLGKDVDQPRNLAKSVTVE
jgi:glucosamine--fructose-6-phosphate aminotransferase (isomerizing)